MPESQPSFVTPSFNLPAMFKALGHPSRLTIMTYLAAVKDGLTGGIIAEKVLNTDQSNVTAHTAPLISSGLIRRTQSGRYVIYQVEPKALQALKVAIDNLIASPAGRMESVPSQQSATEAKAP